ncbi:MAG TPA: acyltransferase domain-containing protein, partial [Vicinamibacteria bacterium]
EAHGTGTPLGDPIELRALGAVYGESRPADTPLLVGSVKTNVGHLEAAAGIAGLIKVVLSLQEAEIPPHLHFREGNPHAPWAELPLVIPTEPRPWPASGGRRLAGLSSFSFTGTNAHMVLAEAPAEAREGLATAPERPVHLLPLSAPSETSLRALAGLYAERLGAPEVPLPDACFTAATGRVPQPERLALRASSREEACAALRAFASGGEPPDLWRGRGERAPGVVFLFTGQGSQYAGMGRQLYETEPAFRAALERCDALLRGHLDRPLLSLLYPADGTTPLDETACAQPALFALEYALAELWRSWGIEPAALLGHSLGEYVAACVAGVFPLEEGLALVAARGKLLQSLPAGGGMVAVLAEEAAVAALLASHGGALAIAAVNGPTSVVVSGPGGELERFEAALAASGVQSRRLAVSHAFHSPLMDPALDELERIASRLTYAAPRLPVGSNLTGRRAEGDDLRTAAYWRRHTRQTVRFADGVRALHADGHRVFLEIGPHPTLAALGRQCVPGEDGLWLGSLRRQGGDWAQMAESLGRLYVAGAPVDWAGFDRAFPRRKVVLPTTRFERRRHWIGDGAPSARAAARPVPEGAAEPWLGRRLRSPSLRDVVFETELGLDSLPYLGDHRVSGVAVAPAAAYVAMALGAAEAAWAGGGPWAIEQLAIAEPLVFPEEGRRLVQVIVSGEDAESPGFRIVSAAAEASPDGGWTEHAQGRLRSVDASEARPEDVAASEVIARCTEELPAGECYRGLRERGFELGPAFQAVRHVWRRDGEALGEVRLPAVLPPNGHHLLHPVLFDASCHVAGAALPGAGEHAYMLVGVDRLAVHAPPGDHVWSHARLAPGVTGGEETVTGDLRLLDDAGRVLASAEGLRFKRARREALAALASGSTADWMYDVAWRPRPLRAEAAEAAGAAAAQVAEAIGPEARRLLGDDGVAAAAAALPELEAVATGFVHRALAALGCDLRPGRRFGAGEAAAWGVLDRHQRLFGRLLDMLVEDGVLRPVDGGWEVLVEPPTADPEAGARALASRTRVGAAELELVRRCGERLADVLRGRADALALLFPGGSTDALERVYRDSPLAVASNAIVQRAVSATLAARPADRPFRLLEVGAGTGATTASVLPSLPASRAEYWFTDVSAAFTERAAARFAGHGFLRTALLDLDRDPHAQGFERHAFDCVVAVNVLHATRDLGETLARLRSLLAPDGLLVVSEATRRLRWLDVTFGLTEGWWSFTDRTRRPAHALLDRPAWLDTLAAAGFEPAVVPGDGAPDTPQAVFLARAPLLAADRPPESWLVLADRGGLGGALARRLRERGDRCVLVASGPADAERPDGPWQVDPSSPADFRRLIAGARAAGGAPPTRVVNLWPLDATAAEGAAAEDVHAAARL